MIYLKKLKDFFFSMLCSVILLAIFGVGIAYATFAESSSGTEYARKMVYNANWFEFLLVLLVINLIGSVIRYKLITKQKFSILLFHLAFILMLTGAGITRYFGSEGMMHIRQGETSNEISSTSKSVRVVAEYNGQKVEKSTEINFSEKGGNNFSENINIGGKTIHIENELFISNSIETIVPDVDGEPALALFVMNQSNEGSDFVLMNGDRNDFDELSFAFGDTTKLANICFLMQENQLYMKTTMPIAKMSMMDKKEEMLMPGSFHPAQQKTIYKTENMLFVVKTYMPKAKKNLKQTTSEMDKTGIVKKGRDGIIFSVTDGNATKKVNVFGSESGNPQAATCKLGDVKVSVSYGMLPHKLPFSITLRAFELQRYPGSNSPSSYASEITVTDTEMKTVQPFRIFMNNILNYRGYRFFQSSYDQDEKGTVLSVSHDYWGTTISYLGYLLMAIGMILTLFNKNSRFRTVVGLVNELQKRRKAGKTLLLAGVLLFAGSGFAAEIENSKAAHLKALSSLMIQDGAQGRVEPFNTFASDILRKISKNTSYKGMSAVEVLLGMSANAANWENEPLIKVANSQLAKEIGAVDDYVSFNQLFDYANGGEYRLKTLVDKVYQKEQSSHNKYDKEIINVDERVNICYQIFNGTMLTIFPVTGHQTGKWTTAQPAEAEPHASACPANMGGMNNAVGMPPPMSEIEGKTPPPGMGSGKMSGMGKATGVAPSMAEIEGKTPPPGMGNGRMSKMTSQSGMNEISEAQLNDMISSSGVLHIGSSPVAEKPETLLTAYFAAVNQAISSGNWADANDQLNKIKTYQLKNGGTNLPSANKIKLEILYNDINIFGLLAKLYAALGFILLIMHFMDIFKKKSGLDRYFDWGIYPFIAFFACYSAGLGVRWYISDHAPWSNGYETMIFLGWAAALSGLVFARKSSITLAVTGILSGIALFVAGMSWMNPEITNLVPVLKSYWLILHVAIITSGYGFLAMGALLGLLNLTLMTARNPNNASRLKDSIQEISYIIELALIIGLVLLTIGCFIGGVWANESWGRYWGWDPKETWALVSILVYAAILHLRNVPRANNQFVLSSLALVGFSSIIMTFFGVNYYLSGMHSYAQGTPPPIPAIVYFLVVGIFILVGAAYNSEKKNGKI